jgi:hypothetical protein
MSAMITVPGLETRTFCIIILYTDDNDLIVGTLPFNIKTYVFNPDEIFRKGISCSSLLTKTVTRSEICCTSGYHNPATCSQTHSPSAKHTGVSNRTPRNSVRHGSFRKWIHFLKTLQNEPTSRCIMQRFSVFAVDCFTSCLFCGQLISFYTTCRKQSRL